MINLFTEEVNMSRVLGVDSGTNGAIVSLTENGEFIEAFLLNTVYNVKVGYDFNKLTKYLASIADDIIICGVEKVHGFEGTNKSTAFSMGAGLQFIHDALDANNIRYIDIAAKTWQNYSRTDEDIVFKDELTKTGKKKIDTKKTALNVAGRLFPSVSFRATKRSTVPHDGIVDSTLIAYYTLNKLL